MWTGSLSAVVAALVLAACGSSSSSSSSGNGVAGKSPEQIVNAAVAAAESAHSVHLAGTLHTSGGKLGLDLDIVTGKGTAGTITEGGTVSFRLVVIGTSVYFQGNRAFWLKVGHSQAAVQLFLGKWIREPASGAQFQSFAKLTSIKGLMASLVHGHGTLSKGASTTVGGQQAIAVNDVSRGGALYVATTGKPYPLKLNNKGSAAGVVTFTQYNHSFTIAAPKDSVDAAQLKQGGA
jgi:hypothetical protein